MRARPDQTLRSALLRRVTATACLGGVLGALALALPASADDLPDLRVELATNKVALTVGGQQQAVRLAVINDGTSAATGAQLHVQVPLASRGVTLPEASITCTPENGPGVVVCDITKPIDPGSRVNITLVLKPPTESDVDAKTTDASNVWVTNSVEDDANNENNGTSFQATLTPKPKTITEISGVVVDGSTGTGLDGVTVTMKDSAGRKGETTSGADGAFSYQPDPQKPFKAGSIKLTATKDGYTLSTTTASASRGGVISDVRLALTAAVASASPSPAEESAAPSAAASTPASAATETKSDSGTPLWLIILLTLLTAGILGGGALWIGLRRNKDDDDDTGGGSPLRTGAPLDSPTVQINPQAYPVGQPGATRVMPGAPQATQVMGAAGATQVMPGAAHPGAYQPASGAGSYQPASGAGAYQPASGGGYQPASTAHQQYQPPAYPPPPPPPGQGYPPPPGQGYDPYAGQPQHDPYQQQQQAAYQQPQSPTAYRSGPGQFAPEPINPNRAEPAATAMFPAATQDPEPPAPGNPWDAPNAGQQQGRWLHSVPPEEEHPSQGRHS